MNGTDFERRGRAYAHAFEILADGCEVPCSFEVFEKELHVRRAAQPYRAVTAEECAREIARNYQRRLGG